MEKRSLQTSEGKVYLLLIQLLRVATAEVIIHFEGLHFQPRNYFSLLWALLFGVETECSVIVIDTHLPHLISLPKFFSCSLGLQIYPEYHPQVFTFQND
ncbi:hypothetical protein QQP08_020107 [Theobroma cacao]|nr:hypothetical protein QQP08_020107 [Theobroma cacao]